MFSGCSCVLASVRPCTLDLLTPYLEKYWTYFHQTSSIGAFWDKDEYFKFWLQKDKDQGHRMTKDPAGGGIQSLHWVLISSSIHSSLHISKEMSLL